ncbi:MAG: hypothetical protein D6753_09325 [Planctomycetota bacterium]|nr:MAG: hypothetical protein D6753_09325 [Planctomycetota bacterium]
MSRPTCFLLGIAVGAAGLYISENYYVVKGKETVHVVRKIAPRLDFPYRDIREYSVEDWRQDPALALAILKSGKEDLLVDSGVAQIQQQVNAWLQSLGIDSP